MRTLEECLAKAQEYERLAAECRSETAKELFLEVAATWRRVAKMPTEQLHPA